MQKKSKNVSSNMLFQDGVFLGQQCGEEKLAVFDSTDGDRWTRDVPVLVALPGGPVEDLGYVAYLEDFCPNFRISG